MATAEAFYDYIGEIALVKDFTSTMDAVMTPEERAEMEAAKAGGAAAADAPVEGSPAAAQTAEAGAAAPATAPAAAPPAAAAAGAKADGVATPVPSATPAAEASAASSTHGAETGTEIGHHMPNNTAKDDKKGKPKLTPEQKAKLEELEAAKEKDRKARIDELTRKLVSRIRPFVEAKHAGDANDPETRAFEERLKTEAEDLKLESFGVEMLHTIGQVYVTRAGNFVKSKKFFGGGFFGRLKEKGRMMNEGFGLLGSA